MNSTTIPFQDIYDISVLLGEEAATFPGDTPFSREIVLSIQESGICDVSKLTMSAHAGTHIDAQSHQMIKGKTVDDYPVERFILPAQVVSIADPKAVGRTELEYFDISRGEALLLKTDNSVSGMCCTGVFSEEYVYLTADAADYCIERGVSLVGIDYVAIDKFGDMSRPAHTILLEHDILILEGINLKDVPDGRYYLFCLPLRIKNGDGSPVRAVLTR